MNSISIIIPVLNEADLIGDLLNHLIKSSTPNNLSEIIVVDGGSTDHTKAIVSEFYEEDEEKGADGSTVTCFIYAFNFIVKS